MDSQKALVRRPSSRLHEGIVDHIERMPVDYELAVDQWEQYVALLGRYGWETIEVARADDCPDSVFVEDTMVVYKNVAMIARPAAVSRRPEIVGAERTIQQFGYSIDRIREPGTLDGGVAAMASPELREEIERVLQSILGEDGEDTPSARDFGPYRKVHQAEAGIERTGRRRRLPARRSRKIRRGNRLPRRAQRRADRNDGAAAKGRAPTSSSFPAGQPA